MKELYFIGMDIEEETRQILHVTKMIATDGMNEGELKAYELGISNALSALNSTLKIDNSNEFVVNINGLDIQTELNLEDFETYLLDI